MEELELINEELGQPYLLKIEWLEFLNYAFAQSKIPLIFNLIFINNTNKLIKDGKVEITFLFDFVEDISTNFSELQPSEVFEWKPSFFINSKAIYELSDQVNDTMKVRIMDGEEELYSEIFNLSIFPMNLWSGSLFLPESIASFVTPNIPEITVLHTKVSELLRNNTKDGSIIGYELDKNRVLETMSSIYQVISNLGIEYALPPTELGMKGQLIRTPIEVLKSKVGTCIEMAILYATLCEACNLNPIIVIIKGHAFAGVWLEDNLFDFNAVYSYEEIEKRIARGINDIELVECTYMNAGRNKSFEQAIRSARGSLDNDFVCAIDIKRSHYFGIRPIPSRVVENGEVKLIDYGVDKDEEIVAKTVEEYFLDTTLKQAATKSDIWLRNLLDLSKRNSLISFKPGNKNIQIFNSNLSKLEDALSNGDSFDIREVVSDYLGSVNRIKMVDIESKQEFISKISEAEFKSKRLRTFLSKEELVKTLKIIYRDTKLSIEESGASSLFLAMGFLCWYDPSDPKAEDGSYLMRYAPIVLVPVDIVRKSNNQYSLRLRDEDSQINITLLEMLRQRFDLRINGLNPLPLDDSGIDLVLVFNSIRKAIMGMKGWNVVEAAFLSNFSFSQFVMWNDLKNRFDKLTENKVVRAFVEGRYSEYNEHELKREDIDKQYQVKDILFPNEIDSSQLIAVIEAVKGNSFVLHGPPGTGKSQTITTMIANALYQGKSVLFVAEKMAALSVVNDRLNKIGLGDFCLEMHSNKINKRVVLDKFNSNFELEPQEENNTFNRSTESIQMIQTELMQYVDELHNSTNFGKSVYSLIEQARGYNIKEKEFSFDVNFLDSNHQQTMDEVIGIIRSIDFYINDMSNFVDNHPLNKIRKNDQRYSNKDFIGRIDKILPMIGQLRNFDFNFDLELLLRIYDVIQLRNLRVMVTKPLWIDLCNEDILNLMNEISKLNTSIENEKSVIYNHYSTAVDKIDITNIKQEYLQAKTKLLFKKNEMNKALIPLNSITINGYIVDMNNAQSEFERIIAYQDKLQNLSLLINKLPNSFIDVKNSMDIVDCVEDLLVLMNEIKKDYQYSDKIQESIAYVQSNLDVSLLNTYQQITVELKQLNQLEGLPYYPKSKDWLEECIDDLSSIKSNIHLYKEWKVLLSLIESLSNKGIDDIKEKIYQLNHKNLYNSFMYSLSVDLIEYYISFTKELSKFSKTLMNEKIHNYNSFIDELSNIAQNRIRNQIIQQFPNVKKCSSIESKEIANIKRAIQSKGRGISIRQLFQENPHVIKKLTPCLLMSPLSVAQYIDLSFPKFDLVIFDEASQIPTSVAVGAMSRATNCIIVGDPNQMPPTSFFSSTKIDEENIQVEDLESLLDDCLAVNMPQYHLQCHYRSQSESLISFSNKMYYNNNMITFPSPRDINTKVLNRFVENGVYDRGVTRTNVVEAKMIVEEIISRIKVNPSDSIGVITFNRNQQILIDDLLQQALSKNRELEEIVNGMYEPIFVKNLENVQGDERDVILFSITFGKDETGKFYQNFGPIAKSGGWRRLNVAVSRSRKEMQVFSSIHSNEINITSNSSEGVRGLKLFLEFSEKGNYALSTKEYNCSNKVILNEIGKWIEEQGFRVHYNIGNSKLNLSIGVLHENDLTQYIGTILIDDDSILQLPTIRDRHRLLHQKLNQLGWKIYPIWTVEWYMNNESEKRDLLKFLQQLPIPEKNVYSENEIKHIVETDLEEVLESSTIIENELIKSRIPEPSIEFHNIPYEYYEKTLSKELVYDENKVAEVMQGIIGKEAPIIEEYLFARTSSVFGNSRLTSNLSDFFKTCTKKLKGNKIRRNHIIIYFGEIDSKSFYTYRNDELYRKDVKVIVDQEICNAIVSVFEKDSDIFDEETLLKLSVKKIGYSRITENISNQVKLGLKLAIKLGYIQKEGKLFKRIF